MIELQFLDFNYSITKSRRYVSRSNDQILEQIVYLQTISYSQKILYFQQNECMLPVSGFLVLCDSYKFLKTVSLVIGLSLLGAENFRFEIHTFKL